MTYTYALLEVSQTAYDEIAAKLRAAGYDHAFGAEGEMDMHGIALNVAKPAPELPGSSIGYPGAVMGVDGRWYGPRRSP